QLVQDLHPSDRGPQGTHHGAIIANGTLYCPQTPRPLLELVPLPPAATPEQAAAHDQQAAELARHKLGRLTSDDADGYHRVTCPQGKAPLPAPPQTDAPAPPPPPDPHPPPAPPRLLPPAPHPRPAPGRSENPAKARLPPRGPASLLRPPHRLRAHLFHHQGPRHHQRRPRLVPPHRPDPPRAMAGPPAHPPQPTQPGRRQHPANPQ